MADGSAVGQDDVIAAARLHHVGPQTGNDNVRAVGYINNIRASVIRSNRHQRTADKIDHAAITDDAVRTLTTCDRIRPTACDDGIGATLSYDTVITVLHRSNRRQ